MQKLNKSDIKDLQEILIFGMFNCKYALNKKLKELKKDKPYLFKKRCEINET